MLSLLSLLVLLPGPYIVGATSSLRAQAHSELVQNSICGLVNRVNETLFREFALSHANRQYFMDQEHVLFASNSHGEMLNLDYCGFTIGDDAIQVDALCNEDSSDCRCTVYFEGMKCKSCTIRSDDSEVAREYPYPVSSVTADCSGISDKWPNCRVEPDGDDADEYPDVQGCMELYSDRDVVHLPTDFSLIGSGAAPRYNSLFAAVMASLVVVRAVS